MIKCTGLAPWEFEFPFPGSLTSTFLGAVVGPYVAVDLVEVTPSSSFSFLLLSSLELSDTQVYEP